MPLVPMAGLLKTASQKGCAVAAFEFWSLDSAQAVLRAAREQSVPVILQAGRIECDYAGLENMVELVRLALRTYDVPVALHLDHGDCLEQVEQALDAGFTSVMLDASHLPFEENVRITAEATAIARRYSASSEGELGRLVGQEAADYVTEQEAALTVPEEAAEYVARTGVDALAVSIGTAHGAYRFPPTIHLDRLRAIAARVSVPLVLHGGSNTPDDKVTAAIREGIAKVNICTEFVTAFGRQYVATQDTPGFRYSVPALFAPSKEAGYRLALEKIRLFQGIKG